MNNMNPRVENRLFAAITSTPEPATLIYMRAMCLPKRKALIGRTHLQRQAATALLEAWAERGLIQRTIGWKNSPHTPTFSHSRSST
jgi:hypothetical protein